MTQPKIYGLIGYPVKHSLSAAMHNAAFRELGINAEYRLFEVKPEELENFLLQNIKVRDVEGKKAFSSQDIVGFNVTIPHKVRTKEILLGNTVKLVEDITVIQTDYVFLSGAINTVKREKGRFIYANTDVAGFKQSLENDLGFDCRDKTILVVGCGGAGRAIIAALTWGNKYNVRKIYVYDVKKEIADDTKRHFDRFDFVKPKLEFISKEETLPEKIKESDLLVNASPIGMKEGDHSTIDKKLLHHQLSVYDVVYNRETQLVKDAKSQGLNAVGGLGMFLYQGAAAFKIWMREKKLKAPIKVMRKALTEAMRNA